MLFFRKYFFSWFILCLIVHCVAGQDTLVLKSGSEIYGKVIEIAETTIKYKNYDNPEGPLYNINKADVFMIFYKNGKRETFTNDNGGTETGDRITAPPVKKNIQLTSGFYNVELVKADVVKQKKDKAYVVSCLVKVNYNSKFFDSLWVYLYQEKDGSKDFSSPKAGYLSNNFMNVTMGSQRLSNILFEKYESTAGKGSGWALPPDFFSENLLTDCEIALLEQKAGNKEILGFGGISFTKMKLMDCSMSEKRILSAVLVWLEVNFGEK